MPLRSYAWARPAARLTPELVYRLSDFSFGRVLAEPLAGARGHKGTAVFCGANIRDGAGRRLDQIDLIRRRLAGTAAITCF